MRFVSILLAAALALPAQGPVSKLNLVIVEGEGAINNIKLRTAREPIVQVEDENHKPVAGAAVVFALPNQGAGGSFGASGQTFTTVTDAQGRAVGRGLRPNQIQGRYQIHVTASKDGQTTNADIAMSNTLPAAAAAGAVSGKLIAIIAIAGGALAGGIVAATRGGGNNTNATVVTSTTVSPGTGSVAPPR
jgi:hypothetical protein